MQGKHLRYATNLFLTSSLMISHVSKMLQTPQFSKFFSDAHFRIPHSEQWLNFTPLPKHELQLIASAVVPHSAATFSFIAWSLLCVALYASQAEQSNPQ
jgi:hypothetical protein